MCSWHETACGALLLVLALGGGCRSYRPRPVDPVDTETRLRERTLDDPGLRAYIETNLPAPPAGPWDLTTLTLAAFYYHPDLDAARARITTAEAGLINAGARPNPSVGVAGGFADPAESPWLYGVTFDLPIETAGKRRYRIALAQHLTDAARVALAEVGWQVRSRVRTALVEYLLAGRSVEVLRAEERARLSAQALLEDRLAVGEVSRPDVDAARTDLANTRLALRAAEGRVAESRAALATALGVPAPALDGVAIEWPALDRPPGKDQKTAGALQRAGLLNRLDIRRSLAEYAAAEAALQLEVAKQYPDLHIGPNYAFDDSANKYKLGVSITLPVLNQNQGPIAEAEARRTEAAARFLALQAQIIGQTHRAVAAYEAALDELAEADRLVAGLDDQLRAVRLAVKVGEADRLALAGIDVQHAVAARARLNVLGKTQTALGALEDAVQRPLDSDLAVPAVPGVADHESPREEPAR